MRNPARVESNGGLLIRLGIRWFAYLIVWVPATHIHYIGLCSVDARLENCISLNHTFVVKLTMSGTLRAFSCGVSAMVSSVMTPLKSQFF